MKVWTQPAQSLRLLKSFGRSWAIEAAAVLGAAAAAMVVTGAMLAGHSVRESLRDLIVRRLGEARLTVAAREYFRAELGQAFEPQAQWAPVVLLDGAVRWKGETRGARILGVDGRFYRFHGVEWKGPEGDEALVSPGLRAELAVQAGDELELIFEKPAHIPRELPMGERRETAARLKLKVGAAVEPKAHEEFSLRAEQRAPLEVFVPLEKLQGALDEAGRVNLLLLRGVEQAAAEKRLTDKFRLEDFGYRLRARKSGDELVLEHETTVLDDRMTDKALDAAFDLGVLARPTLAALVDTIGVKTRQTPYSVVAAVDEATLAEVNNDRAPKATKLPPVVLNQWAAGDLGARVGDKVWMEWREWLEAGRWGKKRAEFEVAGIAAIAGLAADRDLAPAWPGIADKKTMAQWQPALPLDRKRVRAQDEQYWQVYGPTPKAWVRLEAGRKLWGTRQGSHNSVRFLHDAAGLRERLTEGLEPLAGRFTITDERSKALAAAAGSAELGDYFVTLNAFVVIAALLVLLEFFRLGVKRRRSQIRLLGREGWKEEEIQQLFLLEGVLVVAAGVLLGVALAPGYAAVMLGGLKGWWFEAAGVKALRVVVAGRFMVWGGVAGLLMGWVVVWQGVRHWSSLVGRLRPEKPWGVWLRGAAKWGGVVLLLGSVAAPVWAEYRMGGWKAGCFVSGVALLGALLALTAAGLQAMPGLRVREAGGPMWPRARAMASMTLLAVGAFGLVGAEAFRSGAEDVVAGFGWYAEAAAPLVAGELLAGRTRWLRFRLWPGEETSGLNLYAPQSPRVLGVPRELLAESGFRFAASAGESAEAKARPWMLLESQVNVGAVPAIVDRNALQYVLKKRVGDEWELARSSAPPVRFKIMAALEGSPFESEVLIHEKDFERLFPQVSGPRVFLGKGTAGIGEVERRLAGYGFQAMTPGERVRGYRRVDDTYLSIFQALGAFGMLVGTLGLGASVMGNGLRGRTAQGGLRQMLRSEAVGVLGAGLTAGIVCALPAVLPALMEGRSGRTLVVVMGWLAVVYLGGVAIIAWGAGRAPQGE